MFKPDVSGTTRKMSGLLFLILLLCSCATYGPSPIGGDKDITPPRFTGSTPANYSVNFTAKQVRLNFNEYIQLKDAGKIYISPPMKGISYSFNLKQVRIDIMDTLNPDVTYAVNFGNSLTDINESNPLSGFQYIFSQSNSIDTDYVSGIIIDAFTLDPVNDVSILLFKEKKDSLYLVKDPDYTGVTDSNGRFVVNHIKSGCYYVYAVKEKSKNYAVEANEEKIAYSDICISTTAAGGTTTNNMATVSTGDSTVSKDTTAINKDTTAIDKDTTAIYKDTTAIYKDTTAIYKDTTTIYKDTTAINKDTTAIDKDTTAIYKDTTAIYKDATAIYKDTTTIYKDTTAIYKDATTIYKDTTAIHKDTTAIHADTTVEYKASTDNNNEPVMLLYQDKEPQYFLKEGSFGKRGIINIAFNYPINDLSVYIADTVPVETVLANDGMSAVVYTREMNLEDARAIVKSGEYTDTFDLLLTEQQLRNVDTTAFRCSVSTNKDRLFSGDSIILTFTLPLFDYLGDTQLNFTAVGEEDTLSGFVTWQKISPAAVKIKYDWSSAYSYKITVPYCTFSDFFDRSIDTFYITAKAVSLEQFGELGISISGLPAGEYFLQLLNSKNAPVRQIAFTGSEKIIDIKFIPSGEYTVWIYEDLNGNGKWDEGNFYDGKQPEKRWKYNKTIKIEEDWRIEETWSVK
ncbi:MAG: hypothetical protein LBG17_08775 [Bacteroidales bacterium]|jgi:hypothetical protein|nr:hypothetical protein [Bacteroidales bacterium]